MRLLVLAAAALSACALGSGRVETLSRSASFRASVLAIGATHGARSDRAEFQAALIRILRADGIRVTALADSDSVMAGTTLDLDVAGDPNALDEIRRATGADGIVFISLAPDWSSLDVVVIDAVTGEYALRATARPAGKEFASASDAAAAASRALSGLAMDRRKAAAREKSGEIAVPDVGGGD